MTGFSTDINVWVEQSVCVSLWRRPESVANCLQNALPSYFYSSLHTLVELKENNQEMPQAQG